MIMTRRVRKFFSRILILLLSFLALLLANHLAAAAPSKPAKNILLLYSYQSVLPANLEWDGAIRSALKGTAAEPLEFYTEFLDLAQFPEESYLQNLIKLLLLQVLQEVRWKIDGKDGAAAKLELNPSTLRSRMRKLAIVRNQ